MQTTSKNSVRAQSWSVVMPLSITEVSMSETVETICKATMLFVAAARTCSHVLQSFTKGLRGILPGAFFYPSRTLGRWDTGGGNI